jgi:hypothetical protein
VKEFLVVLDANKRGVELGEPYDDPMKAGNDRLGDRCYDKDKEHQ